jgi:hypothetical protein
MNIKSKKRINKKRNKTFKKKGGSSCDNFCKKDYSPEMEKQFKKIAKENKLPYKPTKEDINFRIAACKQNFCNKGCKGYKFFSKEEEKLFKKNIRDDFLKNTKPRIIQKLKSKGAISYCDVNNYNPFHN